MNNINELIEAMKEANIYSEVLYRKYLCIVPTYTPQETIDYLNQFPFIQVKFVDPVYLPKEKTIYFLPVEEHSGIRFKHYPYSNHVRKSESDNTVDPPYHCNNGHIPLPDVSSGEGKYFPIKNKIEGE